MNETTPTKVAASGQEDLIKQAIGLFQEGNLDELQALIGAAKQERTCDYCQLLIDLAKTGDAAVTFVKELISANPFDETELADKIAKEIILNVERYVDAHLEKYQKYTLNAPQMTAGSSKAKFFNQISLLKDVSILGRKLLEASPRFEALKGTSPPVLQMSDRRSSLIGKHRDSRSQMSEDDATSDDLLAALIESSSSDDFLVLSSSLDTITVRDMMLTSLILITSHECFTLSHDIQGVVLVLRRTKFMIKNILAPRDQMELVAKLLTSIGRYNEMNYVFDLFRDRNQFEMLLSKGVEKTPELRVALFNYVKKNPEFYALVTLNFSMFREIAESLEASALKRLDRLKQSRKNKQARKKVSTIMTGGTAAISVAGAASGGSKNSDGDCKNRGSCGKPGREQSTVTFSTMKKSNSIATSLSNLGGGGGGCGGAAAAACASGHDGPGGNIKTNSPDGNNKPLYSKESLNLCLVELVDAAECFAKAGCYKRSNDCEHKAKLIALQVALLASETNVLDLQQSDLNDLIASFESFLDAHIVAQAYSHQSSWRQALFRNVVLGGQASYLDEYCMKCDLSAAMVMELVLLYKQYIGNASNRLSREETTKLAASMRIILARLNDVELKCKLYTQLEFAEAKDELLRDQPAIQAHLKDLKLI